MKKLFLIVCTLLLAGTAIAQNTRLIKGFVQTDSGAPIKGAVIKSSVNNAEATTTDNGAFEINVSPYATHLEVTKEGFIAAKVEIEGSYLAVRLKVDKRYYENKAAAAKAKAEADARAAEQKAAAAKAKALAEEQQRAAAKKEAEAKAKAEADAKAKAQKEAEAKAKAEADAKAKAETEARLAAQKAAEAKAKAEAEARAAAQKAAAAKAKAEADARAAEQKAAAAKAKAEQRRKDYAKTRKGFGSVIDVNYKMGMTYPFTSFGMSYTAGYRFNNQVYLGVGAGANFNMEGGMAKRAVNENYSSNFLNPSLISVPVFAYFKANFIDRRCSPFFALAAGGNISSKQTLILDLCEVQYGTIGGFVNPQLGINLRTSIKTSIYIAAGFQCFTAPSCVEFTGYNAMFRSALGYGLDFHFGLTF